VFSSYATHSFYSPEWVGRKNGRIEKNRRKEGGGGEYALRSFCLPLLILLAYLQGKGEKKKKYLRREEEKKKKGGKKESISLPRLLLQVQWSCGRGKEEKGKV